MTNSTNQSKWDFNKRNQFNIHFNQYEAPKFKKMEKVLMEYFGQNKSQVYKEAVRDKYNMIAVL